MRGVHPHHKCATNKQSSHIPDSGPLSFYSPTNCPANQPVQHQHSIQFPFSVSVPPTRRRRERGSSSRSRRMVSQGGGIGMLSSLGAALQALPSSHYQRSCHSRSASSSSAVYPAAPMHPLVEAFESNLFTDLGDLQRCTGSYLTIEWLSRALQACLGAHTRLKEMLPHVQQALVGNAKRVDALLDDTLRLLDVSDALREAFTEMRELCVALQLAVSALVRGGAVITPAKLNRASAALARIHGGAASAAPRLDKCGSSLRRMGEHLDSSPAVAGKGRFLDMVSAAMATTVFVYSALVAAISFKNSRRALPLPFVGSAPHPPWAVALHALHHRVRDDMERRRGCGSRCLVAEVDAADAAGRELLNQVAGHFLSTKKVGNGNGNGNKNASASPAKNSGQVWEAVEQVRRSVQVLETTTASLEKNVDQLFRVLVATRMALLDIVSYS